MKELLILGSLPESMEDYEKYNIIIETCKKYFDNISSPIDTKHFSGNSNERFKRAIEKTTQSDLIIGEISSPSTGQGIEIGVAYMHKIPLIILAKKGSIVSGLIIGNPYVKMIIYYTDFTEMKEKLTEYFSEKVN